MSKTAAETHVVHREGAATITLSRPFELDGVKMTHLEMREPSVNDQLALDARAGSDAVKEVALLADLVGITPTDVGRLPLRDYRRLLAAYQGFVD